MYAIMAAIALMLCLLGLVWLISKRRRRVHDNVGDVSMPIPKGMGDTAISNPLHEDLVLEGAQSDTAEKSRWKSMVEKGRVYWTTFRIIISLSQVLTQLGELLM